jgi:site-specific DNA-cytosine methylase
MPLLLELFSGTGSVGKVAAEMGYDVISLDRDMEATIQMDIMNWDYQNFPKPVIDVIWASPPCTEYSHAKRRGERKIAYANRIVNKTLWLIQKLNPPVWIMENPQTGLLKNQEFMKKLIKIEMETRGLKMLPDLGK